MNILNIVGICYACRMTRITYLGWMERRIVTEGQVLDHSRWPCRKKQWNNGGNRNNDNRRVQDAENRNYYQSDEEFFVIDEMMNNDHTIRSKKLFILYIKMEDPSGGNRNAANVAWTPLAKVDKYLLKIVIFINLICIKCYKFP